MPQRQRRDPAARGAVNLSDLLLLAFLAGMVLAAVFFYTVLDQPLLRSCAYGVSAMMGLLGCLVLAVKLVERLYPETPPCPCGQARKADFEWTGMRHLHDRHTPTETHYACPCGREWLRRENVFYEKLPSGELAPYMRQRFWRWKKTPPEA